MRHESITVSTKTNLATTDCAQCGIIFAIPDDYDDRLRKTGETFYCPNGHSLTYGKSEADKLRDQLNNAKHRLEWAEADNERLVKERDSACRSASTYKGHLTKAKKRIHAGVCTECHRHFNNLQEHMEHEHGTPEERQRVIKRHKGD